MKKIFKFLGFLLPWFISSIFIKSDTVFYKSLNKPFFAPKPIIFPIVWTILYILIAYATYKIYSEKNYKEIPKFTKALIVNYISNQFFTFLFFTLKSPFLAFIDTLIVLITSLFMYSESKEINKTISKFYIPYIIWNIFATILILSIFLMNLS